MKLKFESTNQPKKKLIPNFKKKISQTFFTVFSHHSFFLFLFSQELCNWTRKAAPVFRSWAEQSFTRKKIFLT